jgi:hypothetical protein
MRLGTLNMILMAAMAAAMIIGDAIAGRAGAAIGAIAAMAAATAAGALAGIRDDE